MLALIIAIAAMLANHTPVDAMVDMVVHGTPVVQDRVFIGLEDRRALPDDDALYAGMLWQDGVQLLQVGP